MRLPFAALALAIACAPVTAAGPTASAPDALNVVSAGRPPAVTAIPWSSARPVITAAPVPTVAPIPTNIRACRSVELRAAEGHGQGATGWWVRPIVVGSVAADPCLIEGPRAVRFVSASGVVIAQAVVGSPDPGQPGWVVLAADSAPAADVTSREGQGLISVWSYGDCDHHRYDTIAIVFAMAQATTGSPGVIGGRCDAPGQRLGVSAGPLWTPFRAATATPKQSPQLNADVVAPRTAFASEALHYTLTLSNTSDQPYSLRDCPWYIEWLGGRELEQTPNPINVKKPDARLFAGFAKESYSLNCAIDAIAPHRSASFEIVLQVPRDALGPDTLRIELVGRGVFASTSITFAAR